mgnify:CR=1 FL=1
MGWYPQNIKSYSTLEVPEGAIWDLGNAHYRLNGHEQRIMDLESQVNQLKQIVEMLAEKGKEKK